MAEAGSPAVTGEPNLRLLAAFGALGLIPFWAPLAGAVLRPGWTGAPGLQLAYGGLILSFLGGVRLGRVLTARSASTTALSMLPSIFGLVVAALPAGPLLLRYGLLIAGFALMWLWDVRSSDLPSGYRRLRTPLTAMAVAALALGAVFIRQV
jgi:hypothetical protein